FTSSVDPSSRGSIASYSMAYPGRIISAASKPGTDATMATCTSIGILVDMPLTYTSWVSRPSGSRKIWCRGLSGNFTILSSMDGQYRGPTPSIWPQIQCHVGYTTAETRQILLGAIPRSPLYSG